MNIFPETPEIILAAIAAIFALGVEVIKRRLDQKGKKQEKKSIFIAQTSEIHKYGGTNPLSPKERRELIDYINLDLSRKESVISNRFSVYSPRRDKSLKFVLPMVQFGPAIAYFIGAKFGIQYLIISIVVLVLLITAVFIYVGIYDRSLEKDRIAVRNEMGGLYGKLGGVKLDAKELAKVLFAASMEAKNSSFSIDFDNTFKAIEAQNIIVDQDEVRLEYLKLAYPVSSLEEKISFVESIIRNDKGIQKAIKHLTKRQKRELLKQIAESIDFNKKTKAPRNAS